MQTKSKQSNMPLMTLNSQSTDNEAVLHSDPPVATSNSTNGKRNSSHINETKIANIDNNNLNNNNNNNINNNNNNIHNPEDSESHNFTIKKPKLESEFGIENGENFETNTIHCNINGSKVTGSTKKPTDTDMAYNIFVRRVVDDTLDRTVTFCEQPKDIISSLEDICSTAFPTLDKGRHRIKIRGYLKACRRNSKKHNGKVSMKDTPSHMCSEKAFAMANEALSRINKELQILKLAKLGRSENPDSISQGNSSDDGRPEIDLKSLECIVDNDSSPSNSDFNYLKYPITSSSDNDPFSAALSGLVPPPYGILPPPPILPSSIPGLPGRGCTPPPAHCNSIHFGPFSLLGSTAQQPATNMLLEKMLHCTSIDPDFGYELLRNKLAAQESISCMRVMARFLLNRSLIMESYLIREMHKSSYYYSSDDM